jgi:hypothetical protein
MSTDRQWQESRREKWSYFTISLKHSSLCFNTVSQRRQLRTYSLSWTSFRFTLDVHVVSFIVTCTGLIQTFKKVLKNTIRIKNIGKFYFWIALRTHGKYPISLATAMCDVHGGSSCYCFNYYLFTTQWKLAKFIEKSVPVNLKIQVGATLHAKAFGTPYVNEKISMSKKN